MKHAHQIKSVAPGSIAEELELEPGDKILQINGQDIEDVLDYRFYIQNEENRYGCPEKGWLRGGVGVR